MYRKSDILEVNSELYMIKRIVGGDRFQKILNKFDTDEIKRNYHCDTVMKGNNGNFYLCNKIDDAQLI